MSCNPGSSSHNFVNSFPELCKWGPSCATILREQFPDCDYDCATCTLNGSSQDSSIIEVEAVEEVGGWPLDELVLIVMMMLMYHMDDRLASV